MSAPPPAEKPCTLLLYHESNAIPQEQDFIRKLESKDDTIKMQALEQIVLHLLNGSQLPKLLMPVIKFCINTENHRIKKLLLLYWEVVEKRNKDGTHLPEMILVCNAMKNDLQHANEYVRGSTLRFLCNMKEPEILESLIPSIVQNTEHRHSYVRKNAVLTVMSVFTAFPDLIPDGPQLIETFLYQEANPSAKRNAFLMLFQCDQDRAVTFLNSILSTVNSLGESFQLVVLELIRKVCRANPLARSQYVRAIYGLVNCPSHAVAFEGANTLVALSSAPTAIRAAVTAYCQLLQAESDNNVKLIILSRLLSLKKRNEKILQEMLMDILRTLSSPNIDIRRKTLSLALDLISPRNVDEVVQLLKKEIVKTDSPEQGKSDAYRKLLVDALHQCAVKFPDVVPSVVHVLLNYLGDDNASSALDVIYFVREIVQEYQQLRDGILTKLMESFDEIRSAQVFRVALWIIGEYAVEPAVADLAISTVRNSVGALPLLAPPKEDDEKKEDEKKPEVSKPESKTAASSSSGSQHHKGDTDARTHRVHDVNRASRGPVVLADGTYASQTAAAPTPAAAEASKADASNAKTTLRSLLLGGDYFLGSCLANAFTKLLLRFAENNGFSATETNQEFAKGLLLFVSIIQLGTAPHSANPIDHDCQQRLMMCVRVLLEPKIFGDMFAAHCREAFALMLDEHKKRKPKEDKKAAVAVVKQADALIQIRHLRGKAFLDHDDLEDEEADLDRAVSVKKKDEDLKSRLNRVYQLTGFADPVYAEAHLSVMEYDVVLDILIVNQTSSVLQNVCVELNTSGDLKVVDRPQTYTLAPMGTQKIQTHIKVTSTDSGIIFGNIVYDSASGTQKTIVVMNNIHMDIMDYISPAFCSDPQFRSMWAEFEWENKVAVNTDIEDLNVYLQHILSITNMNCMTPQATMLGNCNFLASNLYARSMFGEDALLNLSVEKRPEGKIAGYIRIRSKTQGIALSLGDKITAKQKDLLISSVPAQTPAPAVITASGS